MTQSIAIETLSFEQALAELERIVRALEGGETELERSIEAYERGISLKKHCAEKLKNAQAKIEKITIAADGSVGTQELDSQS